MPVSNAMTADFLRSAYGGESMAHMRYLYWADIASNENLPNISRLLKAIAYAEQVHAGNHFTVLAGGIAAATVAAGAVFGVGKTADNLQGAIDGEQHEVDQMYPVYLAAAEFQKEEDAKRSFTFALEAEKIHAQLFRQAQDAARQNGDMPFQSVNICPVCGHTVLDGTPDRCPICGTAGKLFHLF